METTDGCGSGTVGRSGKLRGVPASVWWAAVRLLAVPGGRQCGRGRGRRRRLGLGRRPVRRGPILPSGSRGRGRRVHAPETAGLSAVPRHGRRTGRHQHRRGRTPSSPSHSTATAATARPSAVLRRRSPPGRYATNGGTQPDARTAAIVSGFVQIHGGQPSGFGGHRGRSVRIAERGRLKRAPSALIFNTITILQALMMASLRRDRSSVRCRVHIYNNYFTF